MLKGIYSAASGMLSQTMQSDITADNLANINTIGFKSQGVDLKSFGDALVERMNGNQESGLGSIAQGSQLNDSHINFTQGSLSQTANPLDLALSGDGFFEVKNEQDGSLAYTRAGNFTRDDSGYLVTQDGKRVQGTSGDIQIPAAAKQIMIDGKGNVLADNVNIGDIKVVQFDDNQQLTRAGNNAYTTDESPSGTLNNVSVKQGFLEGSNANVITELVNSMSGMRTYEALQKSISIQNETLGRAVNDIAK